MNNIFISAVYHMFHCVKPHSPILEGKSLIDILLHAPMFSLFITHSDQESVHFGGDTKDDIKNNF